MSGGTSSDLLAQRLSAQIDELARTLAAAGPLGPEGMRLLESAAVAAMHAVSLEELRSPHGERRSPPRASFSRAVYSS